MKNLGPIINPPKGGFEKLCMHIEKEGAKKNLYFKINIKTSLLATAAIALLLLSTKFLSPKENTVESLVENSDDLIWYQYGQKNLTITEP